MHRQFISELLFDKKQAPFTTDQILQFRYYNIKPRSFESISDLTNSVMASSYPRKSLKDVFDIQIPSSSSSKPRSLSPSKLRVPLRNIIQQSISKADFPSWKTLRGLSKVTAEPTSFTLKRNSGYSSLRGNEPDKNFDEYVLGFPIIALN